MKEDEEMEGGVMMGEMDEEIEEVEPGIGV